MRQTVFYCPKTFFYFFRVFMLYGLYFSVKVVYFIRRLDINYTGATMTMNDTININGTEYRFERKGEQLPEFTIGKHSWAQYLQENGGGFFFTVGMIGHTGEKVHSIYTQFITVNGDKVILGFQAVCGSAKINSRTRRIITQPEVNCKCCAKRMAKNIQ